jgi:hypothetical protein
VKFSCGSILIGKHRQNFAARSWQTNASMKKYTYNGEKKQTKKVHAGHAARKKGRGALVARGHN